jgi:2-phospho-L-lactate guanylyltransferase
MSANENGRQTMESVEHVALHPASSPWAIVPVKSLDRSKMRLSQVLTADRRAVLMRRMLQHTLSVLVRTSGLGQILVVSSDPAVWEVARQHGAIPLDEGGSHGLNSAASLAVHNVTENGASAALVLPADLPFLQPRDVEWMIDSMRDTPGPGSPDRLAMVICSDRKEDGTNALLLQLPTRFAFHYGSCSFRKHLQEAKRQGISARIIRAPGLQLDLDTETDWNEYQQMLLDKDRSLVIPDGFVSPLAD